MKDRYPLQSDSKSRTNGKERDIPKKGMARPTRRVETTSVVLMMIAYI